MRGVASALGPALAAAALAAPLAAEITLEEVTFTSDGLRLAAEIVLPAQGAPLPGIALIQGSGASGRDNLWARQFAEGFAERGFAVLLPDKRGAGASEGDWQTAGFDELAADAVASLERLAEHPRVDPDRVGFVGLSQGGHIAPLAASLSERAGFVVDVAGSLVVMEEQLYHELENAYREHRLDEPAIEYLQDFARTSFDYLRGTVDWGKYARWREVIAESRLAPAVATWPASEDDPYWVRWRKIYRFDPLPYWRELVLERDIPCLVIFGARDEEENVPVAASRRRAAELESDFDFELRVYPESGHALFEPGTHRLRRDLLDETAAWIENRLGDPDLDPGHPNWEVGSLPAAPDGSSAQAGGSRQTCTTGLSPSLSTT